MEKKNKIEDFGVKIGGARKDVYLTRGGLSISDIDEMDIREYETHVKKDHVWPKPNYVEMLSEGYSPECIYYTKLVRDALPAKPISYKTEQVYKYLNALQFYREVCKEIKETTSLYATATIIRDKANKQGFNNFGIYSIGKLTNLSTIDISEIKSTVEIQEFPHKFNGKLKGLAVLEYSSNRFYITKNRRRFYKFSEVYDSKEKAMETVKEQVIPYLLETTNKKSSNAQKYERPQLQGIQRIGFDYRKGKDATGEDILNTFHFRGGEFGNWNTQADRQACLNHAFDAMFDLMYILRAPLNFASLGGYKDKKLAIAFGARGTSKAVAHYEPANVVINLTKMNGAGSLAHEWAHALDDYIGIKCGYESLFTKTSRFFKSKASDYQYSELQNAFENLIEVIKSVPCTDEEVIEKSNKLKSDYLKRVERLLVNFENVYIRKKSERRDATEEEKAELIKCKEKLLTEMNQESLHELNKTHKKITNRLPDAKLRENISFYITHYNYQKENIEKIKSGEIEHRSKKCTEFYTKCKEMDKCIGKNYLQTTHEMFARVFEAYVEDALKEQGLRSDYLVHSTFNSSYNNFNPYPAGEERILFNKEMKKFLDLVVRTFSTYTEDYPQIGKDFSINISDEQKSHRDDEVINNIIDIQVDDETTTNSDIKFENKSEETSDNIELVTDEELNQFLEALGFNFDEEDKENNSNSLDVKLVSNKELKEWIIDNSLTTTYEENDDTELYEKIIVEGTSGTEEVERIVNESTDTNNEEIELHIDVEEIELKLDSEIAEPMEENDKARENDETSNLEEIQDSNNLVNTQEATIHPEVNNSCSNEETIKPKNSNPSLNDLLMLYKETLKKNTKSNSEEEKIYETLKIINRSLQ